MSGMFERGGPALRRSLPGTCKLSGAGENEKKMKYREQREIEVAPAPASEADS